MSCCHLLEHVFTNNHDIEAAEAACAGSQSMQTEGEGWRGPYFGFRYTEERRF